MPLAALLAVLPTLVGVLPLSELGPYAHDPDFPPTLGLGSGMPFSGTTRSSPASADWDPNVEKPRRTSRLVVGVCTEPCRRPGLLDWDPGAPGRGCTSRLTWVDTVWV